MLIEVFAGPKGQRTDTNGYHVKIARPTWENIVEHWKQYQPIVPGDTKEHNSTARVSYALIKANKIKEFQGKKHAEKLHEWLKNEANWGTKFETIEVGHVVGEKSKLEKVRSIIKGRCGIYIIVDNNVNNNLAALWMGDDVVGGYNGINNGKTVYFWELQSVECFRLQSIECDSMNMAAIKGFEVINKMSVDFGVEVIATIYQKEDNKYRLNGINFGTKTFVNPMKKIYGIDSKAFSRENIKANIHTHVGENVGENFFSGADFLGAYFNEVPIYLKHTNNDRILKAIPPVLRNPPPGMAHTDILNRNNKIASRLKLILDNHNKVNEKVGIDSCSNIGNRFNRENCTIGECLNAICNSTACQSVCKFICEPISDAIKERRLTQLQKNGLTISNCLFGIFKNHGQTVQEINTITGRPLR